jgi:hypothetical protein
MTIDHVIYATSDLDVAQARIESELGLAVFPGGRHTGLGTHNRIVPLGAGYLELLAVIDREEAEASDLGRAILDAGEGLAGWAVAVDDVDTVARRLGLRVTTICRDGLTAKLTGVAEALREPLLPFFITRDEGIPDPGEPGTGGGITWLELSGDAQRLDEWLEGARLPVRVVDGEPGVRAVGIGERELR